VAFSITKKVSQLSKKEHLVIRGRQLFVAIKSEWSALGELLLNPLRSSHRFSKVSSCIEARGLAVESWATVPELESPRV